MMRIVVLSGGVGGARFTRGLMAHLDDARIDAAVTVVANTGDDVWLHGLRVCPDLDTLMYTLAGVVDESRGWGRAYETETVSDDLKAYGMDWPWFTLGDRDLATHIARTHLLNGGATLTQATAALTDRWHLPVTLLPMSDAEVETHVELADGAVVHFEEWWVRLRASVPARRFLQPGVEHARPAPGVLDAIATADVVVLPPSNPVVSVGTILGVPDIAEALVDTPAPMVAVAPIIAGSAVRGMAEACLSAIGVEVDAGAVALHYRQTYGIVDAYLVDDVDAAAVPVLDAAGLRVRARPLWMTSVAETARIAGDALELAGVTS